MCAIERIGFVGAGLIFAGRSARHGHVRQHDPVLGLEHERRNLANLLCGDRQIAFQLAVDQVGIVEQGCVHREAVGPLDDLRVRSPARAAVRGCTARSMPSRTPIAKVNGPA